MDSNKFLENKVNTVIKIISGYANRVESHDSVTDKYFRLLADNLKAILFIKSTFSDKIQAIKFVIYDMDNSGIIGLAKQYIELAIEQAIEFDKNEVKA